MVSNETLVCVVLSLKKIAAISLFPFMRFGVVDYTTSYCGIVVRPYQKQREINVEEKILSTNVDSKMRYSYVIRE